MAFLGSFRVEAISEDVAIHELMQEYWTPQFTKENSTPAIAFSYGKLVAPRALAALVSDPGQAPVDSMPSDLFKPNRAFGR